MSSILTRGRPGLPILEQLTQPILPKMAGRNGFILWQPGKALIIQNFMALYFNPELLKKEFIREKILLSKGG
jgi:hypothetical protein